MCACAPAPGGLVDACSVWMSSGDFRVARGHEEAERELHEFVHRQHRVFAELEPDDPDGVSSREHGCCVLHGQDAEEQGREEGIAVVVGDGAGLGPRGSSGLDGPAGRRLHIVLVHEQGAAVMGLGRAVGVGVVALVEVLDGDAVAGRRRGDVTVHAGLHHHHRLHGEPRPPRVPVKKGSIFFLWTSSARFESA